MNDMKRRNFDEIYSILFISNSIINLKHNTSYVTDKG
jgi:hypothetical protein